MSDDVADKLSKLGSLKQKCLKDIQKHTYMSYHLLFFLGMLDSLPMIDYFLDLFLETLR